ncbi:hypothetical protein ACMAUO_06085 [Gluconacetobacter sp. Hr-1-5]|uniref:hypothetical protein n=1 Tax=Gluconacetobacter sp. Hr-1-5 TaxID=3395370 RepID=UPI003B52E12C
MSDDLVDHIGLYAKLNTLVAEAGGQVKFAEQTGCNLRTLSNAINGHRQIGPELLDVMGWEKVVRYRPRRKRAAPSA